MELELNAPAGAPAPPKRPAGRRVRPALLFLGLALALLLAGAGGTYIAALLLTTPAQEVQASPALPVYSAVGQASAELVFWPWFSYAEQAPDPYLFHEPPQEYAHFLAPVLELLSSGGFAPALPDEGQGGSFPFYKLAEERGPYSLSAGILKVKPRQRLDGGSPPALLLDVAFGNYHNPHGVWGDFTFTFQVRPAEGSDPPPEGWQQRDLELVRKDVECLFGLNGDHPQLLFFLAPDLDTAVHHSGNDRPGRHLPDGSSGGEYTPLRHAYQDVRYIASCARNFVYSQCTPDQVKLPGLAEAPASLEGIYLPVAADPERLRELFGPDPERALQNLLNETYCGGLDVEVVTLDACTAALFTYNDGAYSFAVYYDPVLQCYSGMAAQYAF